MRVPLLLVAIALLAAGCSVPDPAPAEPRNLLRDGGFEEGGAGWDWLPWSPVWLRNFTVAESPVHSGARSLRTEVESNASRLHGIVGAVQNFTAAELNATVPETLSGWYRVERWDRDPARGAVYVQVVLGLTPDEKTRAPVCRQRVPCQIAYPLAGIDAQPFQISNRKFIFLGKDQPQLGEWVRFEATPRADYVREWGEDPRAWGTLTVYVEARYDVDSGAVPPVHLDVYWDDLRMEASSTATPTASGS